MLEWLLVHQAVLWWLAASSVALFVAAAILVPVLVVHIPRDYFTTERRRTLPWSRYHPLLRGMLLALKNGFGLLLLLAGGLMLVLRVFSPSWPHSCCSTSLASFVLSAGSQPGSRFSGASTGCAAGAGIRHWRLSRILQHCLKRSIPEPFSARSPAVPSRRPRILHDIRA